MNDTLLIRARAAVAGMKAGEIARRPTKRARELVEGGYAVEVESLDDRVATEPPARHLDRLPSNQTGGSFDVETTTYDGGTSTLVTLPDAHAIPGESTGGSESGDDD